MDIGGANTKAAWLHGTSLRTVSHPFEVWRDREGLAAVLREIATGPADAVAITMTAELSDAFRTKREGVAFVLDAAEAALGDLPLSVLTTAGELVSVEAARARPWDVAAANWVATALAVAGEHPDALLIDVGSTTADIVPIAGGRVTATAHNDLERLLAGELVYTGALRTNLAAIAPRVPVRGGWCPVASAAFAISADVQLVLGHLEPEAYDCPTPDGRPATVAFARERIARLVCSVVEQLDVGAREPGDPLASERDGGRAAVGRRAIVRLRLQMAEDELDVGADREVLRRHRAPAAAHRHARRDRRQVRAQRAGVDELARQQALEVVVRHSPRPGRRRSGRCRRSCCRCRSAARRGARRPPRAPSPPSWRRRRPSGRARAAATDTSSPAVVSTLSGRSPSAASAASSTNATPSRLVRKASESSAVIVIATASA